MENRPVAAIATERQFTMSRKLSVTFLSLLGLIGIVLLLSASVVQAQEATPQTDDTNCLACHDDLYYLYDTGKWHCLCQASPSCIHCHGGQPEVANADLAHAGMITNPLQEDAAACQRCHPDEYQQRVDEFMAMAGGTVTGGRGETFRTPGLEPTSLPSGFQAYHLPNQLWEPWRLAGLGLLAVILMVLSILGVYCCRIDRQKPLSP